MKQQAFRCKLIALLLIALLGLAAANGVRTIPFAGESGDLRSAILRLTGQESASAPPSVSPGPAVSPGPSTLPPTGETVFFSPGESAAPLTPDASADDGASVSPPVPLSEALSNYFSSGEPEQTGEPVSGLPFATP